MEEGSVSELKGRDLEPAHQSAGALSPVLVVGAGGRQAGRHAHRPADALVEMPPIYTVPQICALVARTPRWRSTCGARLTELGALELECVASATGNEQDRWKLIRICAEMRPRPAPIN